MTGCRLFAVLLLVTALAVPALQSAGAAEATPAIDIERFEITTFDRNGQFGASVTVGNARNIFARQIADRSDRQACDREIRYALRDLIASENTLSFVIEAETTHLQCRIFEVKVYDPEGGIRPVETTKEFGIYSERQEVTWEIAVVMRPGFSFDVLAEEPPLLETPSQLDLRKVIRPSGPDFGVAIAQFLREVLGRTRAELSEDRTRDGRAFRDAVDSGVGFRLSLRFEDDDLVLTFLASEASSGPCPLTPGVRFHVDDRGLVEGVPFCNSPNHGEEIKPEVIVLHYTVTSGVEGTIQLLMDPKRSASYHFLIARDGRIFQLVPTNVSAYHAGRSRWDGRSGVNGFSIGIGLMNSGRLMQVGDSWQDAFGQTIPPEEVVLRAHKFTPKTQDGWQTYTEEQIAALAELVSGLLDHYSIPAEAVIGQEDVAPLRRFSPGPAFDWRDFRRRL